MLLNCHTFYSLRYGTLSEQDFIAQLEQGGYSRAALTDINNTSAFFSTLRLAQQRGIVLTPGIDFRNGIKQCFVALAKNPAGWAALNQFCSETPPGKIPERAPFWENVFVIYPFRRDAFFALQPHEFIGVQPKDLPQLPFSTWRHHTDKLVAFATATFRNKRDFNAHRLLRAIDNNCLLSKLPLTEQADANDVYRSCTALQQQYQEWPQLIAQADGLLKSCAFDFELGIPQNKSVFSESSGEDVRLLEALARNGLQYRYSRVTPLITERLEKELQIIREKNFVAYFLISWDIVRYAKSKGYFYVGRGSGANSLVAYCLGITDVDPIELDLYFERFINLYRENPPDFDMDFSWKDREDVTRYIFEKHGSTHTALLGAYNTFQYRAAIRELGKVFGLPKEEIDTLAASDVAKDEIGALIHKYSAYIQNFPNYLSIHAGGILISAKPIHAFSATFLPPKGFPTVHFDMHIAEDIGLYKFDILSQRGLGHIKDTVTYVQENQGLTVDIHNIPKFKQDPAVRKLLETGHTMGCFYVESPAMRQLLRKMGCTDYISLVAASSIIRPGVARSGMMQEYIRRYRFPEARQRAHPVMLEIMPETFGVMVYQEDVIKVAHYFADLTLAEADVLRRGMSGKSRSKEAFQRVKDRFYSNCAKKGYALELTGEVWHQIESFAGYSFSKGHSASYAVESFQSLFLKAYYPLEFMCAVINNFGGFYRTEFYIHEARLAGATILAPCVNHSEAACIIRGKEIYLGFIFINGLEQQLIQRLLWDRTHRGPYQDLDDFTHRLHPSLEQLKLLIKAGAFSFTGLNHKTLYWKAHTAVGKTIPAGTECVQATLFAPEQRVFTLPEFHTNTLETAYDQMELFGFTLESPFQLVAVPLPPTPPANELLRFEGQVVTLIGYLVTIKPTKTVKGDRMYFGTFLDPNGQWIDTTHFAPVAKAYPFRGKGVYRLTGKVDVAYGVPSLTVHVMEKLPLLPDPRVG